MSQSDTIRLLILNNSRSEAERLISMLHASGHPCRAQHVESEEALVKLLQEQSWDLLIGNDKTTNLPPQSAIKQIRRLNKDVPVILLHDDSDDEELFAVVEGLRLGAADVVDLDDDQHLLLVIDRELGNREHRQARRTADRRFREAERRSQQLLDSSRDAIAYMQDGLYLYANESFAELFGYEDKDDIEAMPIMDMVADKDQNRLKNFLKDFTFKGEEAESSTLTFTGITADGEEKPLSLEVSLVTYDEEPCIQFLARATAAETVSPNNEHLEAQLKQIKWQDLVTGLYNRQYLIGQLDHIIANVDEKQNFCLMYIDLGNFSERVKATFGETGADLALGDVAALLRAKANTNDLVARMSDSTFALVVPNIKADAAINRANQLSKEIENHIIDIDHKTLQISGSIGISLINENTTNTNTVIEQARMAMEKVRNKDTKVALFEPEAPKQEKKIDAAAMLQQALDNERFRLLFQPIISLRGSDEEYYEVYLRMLNEQGEEISPKQFLEAAASMGANTKIDRWVILESIKMLSEHRAKGNKTKLIVNVSHYSLCDESMIPWLGVAFKAAKLPPDSIIFQAQEIDITTYLNAAKAFSEGLAKLKTSFAISNFGCSLNPFNTLKHVPATLIKIDGSFTTDIQNNNESPETLINMIEQLHTENKITLVPFVENASVLSTLWQAGAHYIQGHYLQEPTYNMTYDFNMES